MKTVILDVQDPKEAMTGFARAWHANQQQEADRTSFAAGGARCQRRSRRCDGVAGSGIA